MAMGERLKEANNINKSLTVLGQVINCLVENAQGKSRHIPYRDSKLTFILKDSLGGNSKTCMIAAISSAANAFCETLSTLKFAQRAKMIKNKALINEESSGNLEVLKKELNRLKDELLSATNIINDLQLKKSETKDLTQNLQAKLTPNYEILMEKTLKPQNSRCKIISMTKKQMENNEILFDFEVVFQQNLTEILGKIKEIEEYSLEMGEKQNKMNEMLQLCAKNEINYRMILKLGSFRLSRVNYYLTNCTNDSFLQEIMNLREENLRLNDILETSTRLSTFSKNTRKKKKHHLSKILSENKILIENMSKQLEKILQTKKGFPERTENNELKQKNEFLMQENTM